jgi:hypothetical protein
MQQQFTAVVLNLLDRIIPVRLRGDTCSESLNLRVIASFTAKKEPDCRQFPLPMRYRGGSVNAITVTDNACA